MACPLWVQKLLQAGHEAGLEAGHEGPSLCLPAGGDTAQVLGLFLFCFPTCLPSGCVCSRHFILHLLGKRCGLDCKEIQPVHPKRNQSWILIGRTDVEAETPILWPPWCQELEKTLMRERLRPGKEGDDRGWDGWMASLTRWTGVWACSGSWRWTGRPGVLQSMGVAKSQTRLSELLGRCTGS